MEISTRLSNLELQRNREIQLRNWICDSKFSNEHRKDQGTERMSGAQMWEPLAEKLQTLRGGWGMTNYAMEALKNKCNFFLRESLFKE